jgi:hypothetical protein
LPHQTIAKSDLFRQIRLVRIAGEPLQPRDVVITRGHLINGTLLRINEWREFGQEHLAYGVKIALPLEHARKFREIRLQPILLFVALRGDAQVVDHRVDVVL